MFFNGISIVLKVHTLYFIAIANFALAYKPFLILISKLPSKQPLSTPFNITDASVHYQ